MAVEQRMYKVLKEGVRVRRQPVPPGDVVALAGREARYLVMSGAVEPYTPKAKK
ncbi:MAG: hypothetical protein AB7E47_12825 [Desulfovibrionaceae bacterium]